MKHRYRLVLVLVAAAALLAVDGVRRMRGGHDGHSIDAAPSKSSAAKRSLNRRKFPTPTTDAVLINADGGEYQWRFRFPGPDGKPGTTDDISAGSELHLPADATVHLTLTSCDNVYVFSVPSLNLRRIAVPELIYRLDFHSGPPRDHDALMDPMCGAPPWYGPTMGRIRVESWAEFDRWFQTVQKGGDQ